MKKLLTMSAILMMAMGLTLTACSSDDDDDNGAQEENAAEVAQIKEQMQANLMMKALCEYDSTTATYTPRIGEAINAPTPTIYYAIANTADDARSTFDGIVSFMRTDSLGTASVPDDVKRGDVHVSFAISSVSDETARITVDCPRLKDVLTAIVFIPEKAWPVNDTATPFNFLSLWRQKTTGYYYICTKDALGGDGQMLTFDGGWYDDWFTTYTHWQGKFYLWGNTSSSEALVGLANGMKYSGDKFQKMKDKLNSVASGSTTYWMIDKLFRERLCITFDRNYNYDHHLWWAYNCYDVTLYKTTFYPDYTVGHWSKYYTHEDTPQRSTASHSFSFSRSYNRKDSEWEAIYR